MRGLWRFVRRSKQPYSLHGQAIDQFDWQNRRLHGSLCWMWRGVGRYVDFVWLAHNVNRCNQPVVAMECHAPVTSVGAIILSLHHIGSVALTTIEFFLSNETSSHVAPITQLFVDTIIGTAYRHVLHACALHEDWPIQHQVWGGDARSRYRS